LGLSTRDAHARQAGPPLRPAAIEPAEPPFVPRPQNAPATRRTRFRFTAARTQGIGSQSSHVVTAEETAASSALRPSIRRFRFGHPLARKTFLGIEREPDGWAWVKGATSNHGAAPLLPAAATSTTRKTGASIVVAILPIVAIPQS
jgi:hypothetical protein